MYPHSFQFIQNVAHIYLVCSISGFLKILVQNENPVLELVTPDPLDLCIVFK